MTNVHSSCDATCTSHCSFKSTIVCSNKATRKSD